MKKLLNPKLDDFEKERDKFIEKAEKAEKNEKVNEWKNILLRIKTDCIKEIDELVEQRMGMTRTAWILEAIQEKLKKTIK